MNFVRLLIPLGGAFALSACAMSSPQLPAPPAPVSAGETRERPRAAVGGTPTTGTLSLDAAIEAALLENPRLRADYARVEALALDVPQASSLPDPMVGLSHQEAVRGPGDTRENMATFSQTFPWFGKRALRGRMARQESLEALEEYRATALDVRRDVIRAWHSLAFEKANRALLAEERELLHATRDAALALYRSGGRDRSAILRVETEIAFLEDELEAIETSIEALGRELQRLLSTGDPVQTSVPPASGAPPEEPPPGEERLIELAVEYRPELEGYRKAEQRLALQERLARRDYYPDVTLGLGYAAMGSSAGGFYGPTSDERTDSLQASVGINLPIPNARRRAAVLQAQRRAEEARLRQDTIADGIAEEIRALSVELAVLARRHRHYESTIVPLAKEAHEAAGATYRAAGSSYVEMLEAQRGLIAARRGLLRIERDHHLARADLERTLGLPLPLLPQHEANQR